MTLYSLMLSFIFFVMIRRPPRSTRTDTLFPYTTRFRSGLVRPVDVARWSRCDDRPPAHLPQRHALLQRAFWLVERQLYLQPERIPLADPGQRFQFQADRRQPDPSVAGRTGDSPRRPEKDVSQHRPGLPEIGRTSCRERWWPEGKNAVGPGATKKKQ